LLRTALALTLLLASGAACSAYDSELLNGVAPADAATDGGKPRERDAAVPPKPLKDGGGTDKDSGSFGGDAGAGCVPNPNTKDQVCPLVCPETCNGEDDDCDLRVDETEANASCSAPNTTEVCMKGKCLITACDESFSDCNDDASDGCETDLGSDPDHCGACRTRCVPVVDSASCIEGVCAAGSCGDATTGACLAACAEDADCKASDYCDGTLCQSDLDDGDACASADQCQSGNCVDGVCCDSACGDGISTDCLACSSAAGAPDDGTCAAVTLGSSTICRASVDAVCDAAEVCPGGGADPYHQEITLNNTGAAQTDLQVRLTITGANTNFWNHLDGGAAATGHDIHVQNDVGSERSFWIERLDTTAQIAWIWVNVPTIAAAAAKTWRIFYGSTTRVSTSSIDSTMIFGDEFTGAAIDAAKWYQPGLTRGEVHTGMPFDTTTPNPGNLGPDALGPGMSELGTEVAAGAADERWVDYRTYIYTGEILITASGYVSFTENIDDAAWLKIDSTVALNDGTWNTRTATSFMGTPGWHAFELRLYDSGGGQGIVTAPGFGYSATNTSASTTAASYAVVANADSHTASLFRTTPQGFSVAAGVLNGTNTSGRLCSTYQVNTATQPVVVETRFKATTLPTNGFQVNGVYTSASAAFGTLLHPAAPNGYFVRTGGAAYSAALVYGGDYVADWTRSSVIMVGGATASNNVSTLSRWSDGATNVSTVGVAAYAPPGAPVTLGQRYDNDITRTRQSYSADWDWVLVRKYAATPPTLVASGVEVDDRGFTCPPDVNGC
jgi:hypothetical protein